MHYRLAYRWDSLDPVTHQILMVGTVMVSELSVIFNTLTHLGAWDFMQMKYMLSGGKAHLLKNVFLGEEI
jgi:ABC-type uncharacterized transport system permease subunit